MKKRVISTVLLYLVVFDLLFYLITFDVFGPSIKFIVFGNEMPSTMTTMLAEGIGAIIVGVQAYYNERRKSHDRQ